VELIHLATLVHDDSVDHSVLRRGMPTVNALFSHQVAVIMGDYLYSRAIIELVALHDLEPLRVFARVTNEMTIGEMRQLEAHDKLAYSEAAYDQLIRSKTASLLSAACEVGALRAAAEHREALARFGEHLGMAFQITDDLLDYTESEEVTGKPVGLDLKEHKVTLPLIAALGQMGQGERRVVADLMVAPDPPDDLVGEVIGLVGAAGGLDYARRRALERDRKSTRLNSSHVSISYAVFCLKKKKEKDVQGVGDAVLGRLEQQHGVHGHDRQGDDARRSVEDERLTVPALQVLAVGDDVRELG